MIPNQFAYDDYHIVLNNEAIHSLETLPGAVVAFAGGIGNRLIDGVPELASGRVARRERLGGILSHY